MYIIYILYDKIQFPVSNQRNDYFLLILKFVIRSHAFCLYLTLKLNYFIYIVIIPVINCLSSSFFLYCKILQDKVQNGTKYYNDAKFYMY